MHRWSQALSTSSEMRVSQNYTFTVAANEQRCWNIAAAMLHLVIVIFFNNLCVQCVHLMFAWFWLLDHLKTGLLLSSLLLLPHLQDQIFLLLFLWTRCSSSFMYDRVRMKFEVGCLAPAHHMADVGCIDLVYQKKMKSFQTLEHQGFWEQLVACEDLHCVMGSFVLHLHDLIAVSFSAQVFWCHTCRIIRQEAICLTIK